MERVSVRLTLSLGLTSGSLIRDAGPDRLAGRSEAHVSLPIP